MSSRAITTTTSIPTSADVVGRGNATRLANGMKFLHGREPPRSLSVSGVVLGTGGASVLHRSARAREKEEKPHDGHHETATRCARRDGTALRKVAARRGCSTTTTHVLPAARPNDVCGARRDARESSPVAIGTRTARLAEERRGAALSARCVRCTSRVPREIHEILDAPLDIANKRRVTFDENKRFFD